MSVEQYLKNHATLLGGIDTAAWERGIGMVRDAFENGRKIITLGNGGSAYAASHYITDWNKMVRLATGKPFCGLSLADNIGLVTAYGNDIGYDEVFAGQLKSVMAQGDLVIAISGSGNSPNVLKAVEYANANGGITLAVVGYDGGKLKPMAHHAVWVPSNDMQHCEDLHLMFGHMVMKALCETTR
jgi:D-sedoheptulose 7-phosphate isomerase